MVVKFMTSIDTKLSTEPQYFVKLLTVILGQSQHKVYYKNIDKNFPSKFDHRKQN